MSLGRLHVTFSSEKYKAVWSHFVETMLQILMILIFQLYIVCILSSSFNFLLVIYLKLVVFSVIGC